MLHKVVFLFSILLIQPTATYAASYYLRGNITNLTSHVNGVDIKIDTGVPTNCTGLNPYDWMTISKNDQAMIAVLLAHYMAGKLDATVYVTVTNNTCFVTQYDPQ